MFGVADPFAGVTRAGIWLIFRDYSNVTGRLGLGPRNKAWDQAVRRVGGQLGGIERVPSRFSLFLPSERRIGPGSDATVSPFPLSFPGATPARRVGSFPGYPFVMIFLARVIMALPARSEGARIWHSVRYGCALHYVTSRRPTRSFQSSGRRRG